MAIPQTLRVSLAVSQRQHHAGEIPARDLPRLRDVLGDPADVLIVDVAAHKDAGGHRLLALRATATLHLTCQRCQAPYRWPLDLDEQLVLVETEIEEARLMHGSEPLLVQDDSLPLRDVIEDEVLLALPMLPRCPSCENELESEAPEADLAAKEAGRGAARPNPFAALKKLKT